MATLDSRSTRRPTTHATTPTGRLTKNADRQPKAGDQDGAEGRAGGYRQRSDPTPQRHHLGASLARERAEQQAQRRRAAARRRRRPGPAARATSRRTDGASPHSAEPRQKTPSPTKNTRRLPSRSAVRPAMTSSDPNTML